MKEGTFRTVYSSGANAGIIERSKCGWRYCTGVDVVAAMPLLWILWRFEKPGASHDVSASLPPSADSWALGDFARWRSTG